MPDGPHYNRVKQAWVLLSHDRRGLLAVGVLFVAGLVVSAAALLSRGDIVDQPPSPCWPSITAAPTELRAGDSLRVSSTGFECGYEAKHYVVPRDCAICTPPALTPVVRLV